MRHLEVGRVVDFVGGVGGEAFEDRRADAALRPVVLNDDEASAGRGDGVVDGLVVNRLDRVEVDHAHVGA